MGFVGAGQHDSMTLLFRVVDLSRARGPWPPYSIKLLKDILNIFINIT
jgi:hypothetical protein